MHKSFQILEKQFIIDVGKPLKKFYVGHMIYSQLSVWKSMNGFCKELEMDVFLPFKSQFTQCVQGFEPKHGSKRPNQSQINGIDRSRPNISTLDFVYVPTFYTHDTSYPPDEKQNHFFSFENMQIFFCYFKIDHAMNSGKIKLQIEA